MWIIHTNNKKNSVPTSVWGILQWYWLQWWIINNVWVWYIIWLSSAYNGRKRVKESIGGRAGAHRGLGCINGLRCTSGVLRAEICEKTVSCQFDVFGSGQMVTRLLTSSKSAGTNPDLLLTSYMNPKCVWDMNMSMVSPCVCVCV